MRRSVGETAGELEVSLGKARESFVDSLLVRIHFIIVMIRWTGLASWGFEFPFPGSHTCTFLENEVCPGQSIVLSETSTDNHHTRLHRMYICSICVYV